MAKCIRVRAAGAVGLLLLAGSALAAPQLSISPLGYQITQVQPVPGIARTYDVTARAGVINRGDPALGVTAHLTSASSYFRVLDGDLSFGDVPRTPLLRPVLSRDTYRLRVTLPPRRQIFEFARALYGSLVWSVSCANCGDANRPPLADAGTDQTVYVAQLVTLDGSGSTDPDGQALTYAWSFVSRPAGSAATLSSPTSVGPSFTPDREGDYVVQLVVTDGQLSSAPDTVQISTRNSVPVAHAGADRAAMVGETVILDGSASSDIDGDPLTYAWSVATRPAGSTAQVEHPSDVDARFTPDVAGDYLIELVVDDGTVSSAPDTMMISTSRPNTPPVANAGPDQSARVGEAVQLDGSASSDADGDPLTFAWSLNTKPASSAADLQGTSTPNPSLTIDRPGTYVAQLIVRDGTTASTPDTVAISTANSRPVAAAGPAQTVRWNTTVQLDGSGSSDPDGDALAFTWSILSRPVNSGAALSDPYAIGPSFVADRPGVYVVQLIVGDGSVTSDPASVSVTATNQSPVTVADSAAVGANGSVAIAVLGNDSDPDGDALSIESVTPPAHGTATIEGATVRYAPATGFAGDDTFNYTATDGVASASAAVSVTVGAAANRDPVANPDSSATTTNTPVTIDVLANDSDPDGDTLTITALTQPPNGTATIEGSSVRFLPTTGFSGATSFEYTIEDGNGGTASALVSVEVAPSTATALSIDDLSVPEGDSGTSTAVFTVTLSAPSAQTVSVSWTTADGDATAPQDYAADSGTAQIAAGNTTAEIAVTINGDTLAESDEALSVRLSNPVNATIADSEAVAIIVDDDPGAPTSHELIAQALADGVIDDETALIYSVYAEMQDPRLPVEYRGRADQYFEGIALREAGTRFDSLSPATQATLAPFFEFPDLFALAATTTQAAQPNARVPAGAAMQTQDLASTTDAPTSSYATLDLVPGSVRVGWDANSPVADFLALQAQDLKAEFDARIWPKLQVFLGAPAPGRRILILLAEGTGESYETIDPSCTLAKIWLYQVDPWVFVHELTHALIDLNYAAAACRIYDKLWMHEATATWAQHYVYPPANQGHEQPTAARFLRQTEKSLSTYERSPQGREYGAYLWFLRLAGQENNPGIVRATWQAASGVTSLQAIENTLQSSGLGGFKDQWPKFALDNWNREAPYRKYQDWDGLTHQAAQGDYDVDLEGKGWDVVPLDYDLPFLSATYQRFNFDSDQNVRGILFLNSAAGDDPNLGVHAIVKLRNQPWGQAEDWSSEKEKYFCRDNDDQDVEEIILVVTNRGFDASAPNIKDEGTFSLYYSAVPCSDWTGSSTYRNEIRPLPGATSITTAVGSGLRFRMDLTQSRATWIAIEGSVTVRQDDTQPFEDGTCTGSASTTFDAAKHAQLTVLPDGNDFIYFGDHISFLPSPPRITQTFTCTSSSGTFTIEQEVPYFGTQWFTTGPTPWPFDPGTTSLTGTYPATASDEQWTWNLAKAP